MSAAGAPAILRVVPLSLGAGGFPDADQGSAWFYATSTEPTLVHFQSKPCRGIGAVVVFGLWLHFTNIDDGPIVVNKGNGEGDQGIFHPHAVALGRGEYEEHAFVGTHSGTLHESLHSFFLGAGHFSFNTMEADEHLYGRALCLETQAGEEQGKDQKGSKYGFGLHGGEL